MAQFPHKPSMSQAMAKNQGCAPDKEKYHCVKKLLK
jgi:hypothetical protein